MQCPKCKTIVDDNATVCPKCHKVFLLECPNCHDLGESAICSKCGYSILVKCSKCSKVNLSSLEKCSKCGFPISTSIAYQECETDEFAAVNITFGSLKNIRKQLKSKELYTKFFIKLKNLLMSQIKGVDAKLIIYNDRFVLNFNKELSLATSSDKALRFGLKILNAFTSLNEKIIDEFSIPLNLIITIIKKDAEQLQNYISHESNIKLLTLKKCDKKYLKGMQIAIDQYICDVINKDYKTDSLYSVEENGKTTMYYEVILDNYVLPPSRTEEYTVAPVKSEIKINTDEEKENGLYAFKVFDINAKCRFDKIDASDFVGKFDEIPFEKGGRILSLCSNPEYALSTSELSNYFEKRDLKVLNISCNEEMNYKPWGFFDTLFRTYAGLSLHNGFIDLSSVDKNISVRHKSIIELLFGKSVKAMTAEDARFAYVEIFSKFLASLKDTVIIIDGFKFLDDSSIQVLELYFDKFKFVKPNFVFITDNNVSAHSKFKGLLRTDTYIEFNIIKTNMENCLSTLKSDASDFIQSFYFEKIKQNFKGSYLYFKNAIEYLKDAGVLIDFQNKLIIKNKKSVIMPKDLKGLYKHRVKQFAKNIDLSMILAYSTILGARLDYRILTQLGIKDVEKNVRILQDSGFIIVKDEMIFINNFSILSEVLKASIKSEVNKLLAKTIIAQLGKGLDNTTMIVVMGILGAYKEEYLTLWKNSQFAINTGDYDAYLKNCLGFLSLVDYIETNISDLEIEENKKEVYNNILMFLYAYSPSKIYYIENILLLDAIKNDDNEKIVKLSNLMLQGALLTANYTDASGLLHNILSRMQEPTLLVGGNINTKFLLLSLVNIEILYNIGDFKQCIEVAEKVLSVLSFDVIEKVKPASFSTNLFINHIFETLRLVLMAKLFILDPEIEDFILKIEEVFKVEFPEKDCILAIRDYLAGKVYSTENIENASSYSKVLYLILQEFNKLDGDYKKFAQNIYQAKLLALDINQKELELFCDLLIAYSYEKIGINEKALYIYDDILSFAEKSAIFNILILVKYFKAKQLVALEKYQEALVLINDSLVLLGKYDNQAKILYLLHEKLYIEIATFIEVPSYDKDTELLKLDEFKDNLKIFFNE